MSEHSPESDGVNERFGLLAAAAAAAGMIAVATIGVEIMTDRLPARVLGWGIGFVSLPLGAATAFLGVLTTRHDWRYGAPSLVLGAVYWVLFAAYW